MLKKQEKNAVTRSVFLAIGWGLGLDRFYEGDVTGGFLAIIGFVVAAVTIFGLIIWLFPFFSKTFRLLREFESADD